MREHFEKFLGLGNASDNENDLLAYSYDASEIQGRARIVLFPSQDEQLRLILTFCNRSNLDVVFRGNGSNHVGMAVPQNSIVISMQGFDRIHALNVNELWVKVDAGVTLGALNEALKEHGFRFPLEPADRKLTTVGGFISANGCARQSQLYGRALDNVVELEVMDGTGKAFITTKELQEYIGNEGSVFAIIRAKLKIIPLQERSIDLQYFDTIQEALSYCNSVEEHKPLSIKLLEGAAATYVGFNTKHTVAVEWEGEQGALRYEQYAAAIAKLDHVRRAVGTQGYIIMEDGGVDKEHLVEALDWCRDHGLPAVCYPGLGIVHPFMKREQEKLREEWNTWLTQRNQNPVAVFGYGLLRKQYVPTAVKNKIRKLKERYDYNNIIGRGKLYDYV